MRRVPGEARLTAPSNGRPDAWASRWRTVAPGGPAGSSRSRRPLSAAINTVHAVASFVSDAQRKRCPGSPRPARTPSGPSTTAAAWSAPQVSIVDRTLPRSVIRQSVAGPGRTGTSGVRSLGRPADGESPRAVHAVSMQRTTRRRTRAVAPILAALLILLTASIATATEFPAGRTGYHSYTETTAEVAAVAAAHPDIVSRFSIGKSYKGRDIWAVKISDNVRSEER